MGHQDRGLELAARRNQNHGPGLRRRLQQRIEQPQRAGRGDVQVHQHDVDRLRADKAHGLGRVGGQDAGHARHFGQRLGRGVR